ncbi:MAG: hypothetical protein ACSLE0_10805 [Chitinophagaceae bacterium]
MQAVNKNQLFISGYLATLVMSLSAGIRGEIPYSRKYEFALLQEQTDIILSMASWGYSHQRESNFSNGF